MKRIFTIVMIITLALPLFAFDFFFDAEETTSRNISLTLEGGVLAYVDDGALAPYADLTLKAEQDGANYRAVADITYDSTLNSLEAQELSLSLFFGQTTLKAGLMRHSWGTADTAHVVDIVNGRDLRNGIVDDLELMKRPDWMLTLSTYFENGALDLVVKPGFNPSYVPMDGKYSMVDSMMDSVKYAVSLGLIKLPDTGLQITEMNTHSLSTVSAGARYRFLFDPVDIGVMYYTGHFHDPGFEQVMTPPNTLEAINLLYTRYHFMGLASSYFLEPFTLAVEGGMFFSEDKDGTDIGLYNSKAVYLAELSYTNPNNSLFVALNYQGQYVFNFVDSDTTDVDYLASFNGKAYQNNFTLAMEYPFMQEKLKARVAGTFQLESLGYAVMGSLTYDLDDAVEVFAKTTVYGTFDEDRTGLYNTWKKNSQVQLGVRAWF
jgi:hypothetical protein